MSGLHFDSQKTKQQGKPDAGKPHVRFDEGEASRPSLGGNLSTLLKTAVVGAICSLLLEASALEPAAIDEVLSQTTVRQEQALVLQEASPYPATGMWLYEDYALAAYWLNTNNAVADAGLIELQTNTNLYQESVDTWNYHWHAYLQARIYFLFSSQSDFFPGRMSAAAEDAVLEMLWDWASVEFKIGMIDPTTTFCSWGSENHDAQAWVSYWSAAQIFAAHPYYQTLTYADGTTPAEMAAEFNEYFKAYVRERALKGTSVEVGSPTYAKYTLNTWLNLADFADDPELKEGATALLDIYWADWALEQIDGVRGGSRHRSYAGRSSIEQSGAQSHCWVYFGVGLPLSQHPGAMCAMTTLWRPSRATVGLVLDAEGRGSYGYASRRLGHRDPAPPPEPPALGPFTYNLLDPNGGHLLRTTWCTPDFVMGISQVDVLPADNWIAFSSQNRWNGVIFGGHTTARIFTQRPMPVEGSVYNAEWGVQHKGAMILQRITTSDKASGQMVWFDFSLNRQELNGWIFAEAPRAYAAVRVVAGGWSWVPDWLGQHRDGTNTNIGEWAVLNDQFSPVILETGRKQNYASMAEFQAEILNNPLVWDGAQLDYTSTGYDTTLTLFADESALPRVDGTPIDLAPAKNYDSPYLQGDFAGGPVIINYGDDRTVHGVAPFAEDANTIAHWDFETTVPAIHPDSTNSIQLIADGKFGGAIHCDFEEGDQYLMTANAWPTNQGTFRYQGWIRLNSGDAGGMLFHVYDQVYLSVDSSAVTFKINRSGDLLDLSATNQIELSAAIASSEDWQYIEAAYDGGRIKLITETETVSAPGIGVFFPNIGSTYIGSRKNKSNFVGDMDEVKISSSITDASFVPDPVVVAMHAQHFQSVSTNINIISGVAPAIGSETKLVVAASWESGTAVITNITYGSQTFTEAITRTTGRNASIWYLDEPVLSSGNVVVQLSESTASLIGVVSLQNAAAGDPDQTASATYSTTVGLTTTVEDSWVIGVYTENGGESLSSDFANTLYTGSSGSSVGNAGYQVEAVPGSKTYSWTATTNSCAVVAASFPPASFIPPIVAGDDSDADADGMADAWEIQQFGNMGASDGSSNSDADSFNDLQEFIAGTDPFDADSQFRITGLSDELRWRSVQGKSYRILTSTNLVNGGWSVDAAGIPGGLSESSHPVSNTNDTVFMKVEVE